MSFWANGGPVGVEFVGPDIDIELKDEGVDSGAGCGGAGGCG